VFDDTLIGLKHLLGVALVALLVMVGGFASVAYAATIHGTNRHDWGKAEEEFANPPNCGARCGKMIHGTDRDDTIYGIRVGTTSGPSVATTWYTAASGWR